MYIDTVLQISLIDEVNQKTMRVALYVQNKSLKKAGELSLYRTTDVTFKCCPSSGKGSYWPETLGKSLY